MHINNTREALLKSIQNKINITNCNVLIFGAGNSSQLCASCFEVEEIDIKAFIDNNPTKTGKSFLGKKIISLNDANKYENPVILISSANQFTRKEVKNLLKRSDFENYFLDEYVFKKNNELIMKVFDMFDDDRSREVYADMILTRMGKKSINCDLVSNDKNFAIDEFANIKYDEIFVDCGAYVGDTIEEYIKAKEGVFNKIYAFEPDVRNFNAMKYRIDRLKKEWALSDDKIICVNAGVGENKTKMALQNQTENAASLSALFSNEFSDSGIDVYALDDYFADQKISFVKADIEGYEEKMIKGAKSIIKRDKPLMAICVYHTPSDMYRIPLILKEFNPEYRFSLRQHHCELSETVLYVY